MPKWQQSFAIKPRSVVDMRGPGFAPAMQTAYWGTDNCLYGNPREYPIMAPPYWSKPPKDYTSMYEDPSHDRNPIPLTSSSSSSEIGCASKQYAGPAVENPWNIKNYGTSTPDTGEPSDFLDQLRFYRDYEPLYRTLYNNQKKSDADTSDDTASADTSYFNTDLGNSVDYSAFLPSSDDSSSHSDITWNVNTDSNSNYMANLDLGTDNTFATTNPGINLDAIHDLGTGWYANNDDSGTNWYANNNDDLGTNWYANNDDNLGTNWAANDDLGTADMYASSDLNSGLSSSDFSSNDYDFWNSDGLFTKPRTRRSARDFLQRE